MYTIILHSSPTCLVSQAMQWPSQAIHSGSKGKVRVRKGASHEVSAVSRHVSSLVVAMDCQVQPHQLCELGVLVSKHRSEIGGPVLAGVNGL